MIRLQFPPLTLRGMRLTAFAELGVRQNSDHGPSKVNS
jgi:hypothetical protein